MRMWRVWIRMVRRSRNLSRSEWRDGVCCETRASQRAIGTAVSVLECMYFPFELSAMYLFNEYCNDDLILVLTREKNRVEERGR